ncbi:GNAT family N-acetyltransferase [Kribbella sandramycini]|uniref:GNAT superfamily N-acetyltransferase n=1 Tax=Kribbella sandramycini TaxID=60450 RepID=A0A841SKC4_9ACTN|nr:GNAT superfamily N-acetyltransferase [Kribbella sandramycini]
MQIRPVAPSDAAAVNELLGQLGYLQDDVAGTTARIRFWADDPASAAYVADADGNLLGVVAVHVCPYFERAGFWGRMVALVVAAETRGQGIGGQLVAAAERFAAERGCDRMEVSSSDHRRAAHAFYLAHGYVDQAGSSSRFRRDLSALGAAGR